MTRPHATERRLSAGDQQLAQAIRDGDPHAFRAAFETYFPRLTAFALRYVGTTEGAEDVVQDVFIRVWHQRDSLDQVDHFGAYLFRAVRNRCLNHIRRRRLEQRWLRSAPAADPGQPPSVQVELDELATATAAAIRALPPKTREVFLMSRVGGLSYQQIASARSVSVKTIETLMGRALRSLRDRLAGSQ